MAYSLTVYETPQELIDAFQSGEIPEKVYLVWNDKSDVPVFSGPGAETFGVDRGVGWHWITQAALKLLKVRVHFT